MNKQIQKPLIVTFYQPQEKVVSCSTKGSRVYVPVNVNWNEFTSVVNNVKENGYDSILVQVDKNVDLDQKGVVNTLNIKMSHLVKIADEQIPVLTTSGQADEEPWYLMNPTYEDQAQAHGYVPANDTVMAKYNEYEDNDAWQKHQNQIWTRMADMMPLSSSTKYGSPDHLAALTDPSRGLERSDVTRFFSYRSNKMLSPALMGDNMIGMPGVDGKD
ncbi:MAG: hypothetical protein IIT65_10625, partial [Lachnospiraceae bacterium]|nr:hypothetical protein [Lachnospiraceae bacterium]